MLRHVLTEDFSRHRINIGAPSGSRLKELPTKIKLEKVEATSQVLMLQLCSDRSIQKTDSSASLGGSVVLKGCLINFDPADSNLCIFFVSTVHIIPWLHDSYNYCYMTLTTTVA